MPVHNCELFLRDAIDSILSQTFKDFELILINDNSTDSTGRICVSYAKKDGRIRLIEHTSKNAGLVPSLNEGLSVARADLIARMDGDDISDVKRFEYMVKELRSPTIDLVVCGYQKIDENNKVFAEFIPPTGSKQLATCLGFVNFIAHGSVIFRKTAVQRVGCYGGQVPAEDYALWLKIAKEDNIAAVPKLLFKLRDNPTGISRTQKPEQIRMTINLQKEFWRKNQDWLLQLVLDSESIPIIKSKFIDWTEINFFYFVKALKSMKLGAASRLLTRLSKHPYALMNLLMKKTLR